MRGSRGAWGRTGAANRAPPAGEQRAGARPWQGQQGRQGVGAARQGVAWSPGESDSREQGARPAQRGWQRRARRQTHRHWGSTCTAAAPCRGRGRDAVASRRRCRAGAAPFFGGTGDLRPRHARGARAKGARAPRGGSAAGLFSSGRAADAGAPVGCREADVGSGKRRGLGAARGAAHHSGPRGVAGGRPRARAGARAARPACSLRRRGPRERKRRAPRRRQWGARRRGGVWGPRFGSRARAAPGARRARGAGRRRAGAARRGAQAGARGGVVALPMQKGAKRTTAKTARGSPHAGGRALARPRAARRRRGRARGRAGNGGRSAALLAVGAQRPVKGSGRALPRVPGPAAARLHAVPPPLGGAGDGGMRRATGRVAAGRRRRRASRRGAPAGERHGVSACVQDKAVAMLAGERGRRRGRRVVGWPSDKCWPWSPGSWGSLAPWETRLGARRGRPLGCAAPGALLLGGGGGEGGSRERGCIPVVQEWGARRIVIEMGARGGPRWVGHVVWRRWVAALREA
jgi:hypothetical protein